MIQQPRRPDDSREPLRLMVVVAHPHDFTHCAGTCGIHASRGDAVSQNLFDDLPVPSRALQKARGRRLDQIRQVSGELPRPSKP